MPGLIICTKPPRKPVAKEACLRNVCFPSQAVIMGSSFNHPGKDLLPSGRYMMLTQYLSTAVPFTATFISSLLLETITLILGIHSPPPLPSPPPHLRQPSCRSAAAQQLTSLCFRPVGPPAQFLLG